MLVGTDHPFVVSKRSGIEFTDTACLGGKGSIAWHFRREPHPFSPGFEPMRFEDSAHRFSADVGSNGLLAELAGDLLAIPQTQGASAGIRALTGDLDGVEGDLRKKTGVAPVVPDPLSPQGADLKSV